MQKLQLFNIQTRDCPYTLPFVYLPIVLYCIGIVGGFVYNSLPNAWQADNRHGLTENDWHLLPRSYPPCWHQTWHPSMPSRTIHHCSFVDTTVTTIAINIVIHYNHQIVTTYIDIIINKRAIDISINGIIIISIITINLVDLWEVKRWEKDSLQTMKSTWY